MNDYNRLAIQTRVFDDIKYENAFRACTSLLQEEGYVISEQDPAMGVIVGLVPKTERTKAMWNGASGGTATSFRAGEEYELSINIERVPPNGVKTRLSVQRLEQMSLGGLVGRELLDRGAYEEFYQKLTVEMARRGERPELVPKTKPKAN